MSWPLVEFGEVASFINGDRGKNYPSKGSFIKEGIPFISAGNLSGEELNPNSFNYISEERFNLLSNGKVKENDILFCLRGSLGKFAVVKGIECGAIASSLVIIRNNEKITLNFLKHYLGSPLCQREINQFENGAAQPNLSAKDLKSFKIPLPPLDEQKRIAAILDKADAIRRKRQQAINLADDFLRSVFLDMFGDPMFSEIFERKKFSEIATLQQGLQIPISQRKKEAGVDRYKYLTVKYLNGKGEDEYIESPRKSVIVQKNQVLMTRTGNTGQVISGVEGVFHNNFFRIDFDESLIDKSYLVNFLTFPKIKSLLLRLASTTTIPDLNHSDFLGVSLQIPPMEQQKEFSKIEVKVINSKVKLTQSLEASNDAFNSLSQKAFSGEL